MSEPGKPFPFPATREQRSIGGILGQATLEERGTRYKFTAEDRAAARASRAANKAARQAKQS